MKCLLLFWTVRNLKPIQIVYQVRYRLFGFTKAVAKIVPIENKNFNISIKELDEDEKYISHMRPDALLENTIWILNERVTWNNSCWEYSQNTHLWNFNLHYFEYGIALAVLYKSTYDESYYRKLKEMYESWHEHGKKVQDAWHPYTISLRIKNLFIIYGILEKKKDEWLELIRTDVYEQYLYLQKNKEKNLLGNHYFENLVTLYLCSVFFVDKKKEIDFKKLLLKEIREEILDDGMHFERSFMYHNIILEDLLRVYVTSDESLRLALYEKIKKMVDVLNCFEDEERLPLFNDSGANVAKKKKQIIDAARKIVIIEPSESLNELPYAGYYKLQKGKFSMIVDVGDVAPKYISGHGHCDMLSFELFYDGEPILVNSGTYQYQTEFRSYFRSTKAHNTLQIDGTEQSEIWGAHRTGRIARIIERKYKVNTILAVMNDFRGNRLKRQINVSDEIQITDSASSQFTSYWHIHPDNKVSLQSDDQIKIVTPAGTTILMNSEGGAFTDISDECHYSENFGEITELSSYKTKAGNVKLRAL